MDGDFRFLAMRDFMVTHLDQATPKFLVSGWLPESTIAFAISPPGAYKTWLTLDLAVSVATGTKFLDHFDVEKKGPVMLIQQEDFAGQTAKRINVIVGSRFNLKLTEGVEDMTFDMTMPPDIPIFIHPDRKLKFADKNAMQSFEQAVAELKPALVIIDPLYSAGSTEDYMAKTAEQMFVLKTLRDKYGCAFLVAHHTKKSEEEGEGMQRDRLWGSQFLNAFLETGWQIKKTKATAINVSRHFKSAPAGTDVGVAFDMNTDEEPYYRPSVVVKDSNAMDAHQESLKDDGYGKVLEVLKNGPISQIRLAKEFGVSPAAISRKLKKMEDEGLLVRVKVPNSTALMIHPATPTEF
jgi:hypothetical protein